MGHILLHSCWDPRFKLNFTFHDQETTKTRSRLTNHLENFGNFSKKNFPPRGKTQRKCIQIQICPSQPTPASQSSLVLPSRWVQQVWQVICPGSWHGDCAVPQGCRNPSLQRLEMVPCLLLTLAWSCRQHMIYLFKITRGASQSLSGTWNKYLRCNKVQIERGRKKEKKKEGMSWHILT